MSVVTTSSDKFKKWTYEVSTCQSFSPHQQTQNRLSIFISFQRDGHCLSLEDDICNVFHEKNSISGTFYRSLKFAGLTLWVSEYASPALLCLTSSPATAATGIPQSSVGTGPAVARTWRRMECGQRKNGTVSFKCIIKCSYCMPNWTMYSEPFGCLCNAIKLFIL